MEKNQYSTTKKRGDAGQKPGMLNTQNNNRFRSVSKTPQIVSKKDAKKHALMNNIPGFGAGHRDSRLDVKSAVRPSRVNELNALKMKGSALNLHNQE
jgi:hypothetical protein